MSGRLLSRTLSRSRRAMRMASHVNALPVRALASYAHVPTAVSALSPLVARNLAPALRMRLSLLRFAATIPANRSEIEERVLKVITEFERVDKSKVSLAAVKLFVVNGSVCVCVCVCVCE
jgi:hypothetical protein